MKEQTQGIRDKAWWDVGGELLDLSHQRIKNHERKMLWSRYVIIGMLGATLVFHAMILIA